MRRLGGGVAAFSLLRCLRQLLIYFLLLADELKSVGPSDRLLKTIEVAERRQHWTSMRLKDRIRT